MKKNILSIICIAAALCACSKEQLAEKTVNSDQEQLITATVNMDNTKLAFSENQAGGGAGLASKWEEGDTFYAYTGSELIKFTLTSGAGTATATFQAKARGIKDDTQWLGVFGNHASVKSGELHCSYLGQDGTLENLADYSYMTASATGKEPVFNFSAGEKYSYILRVKLPAGIKCIEYNPCAWEKITSSGATLQLYSTGDQESNYKAFDASNTTTITLDHASVKGETIYIAVPTINCNLGYEGYNSKKQYGNLKTGIILTFLNNVSNDADMSNGVVLGGDKNEDFNLSDKGGQIGTYDYSELPLINRPKPSEAILIETGAYNQDISTTKEYVNGLETYWAPFNVGASTFTESGYFYGYGEANYERKKGDFASYTLRQKGSDGTNRPAIICYSHSAFPGSGASTFYTIAGTRYDVARIKWGIAWRMPYAVEAGALWNKHKADMSSETVSGQKCMKVGNGSGQFLYIPCCGWYSDSDAHKDTDYACVWTADKNQRSASNAGWDQAYAIQYTSTTQSDSFLDRYGMHRSLNVRPVLASSVIE